MGNRRGSHDLNVRSADGFNPFVLADERVNDCNTFVLADERVNDCNTFVLADELVNDCNTFVCALWRLLGGVRDGWPIQVSCDAADADCAADYGGADSNGYKADWHSCAAAGTDR